MAAEANEKLREIADRVQKGELPAATPRDLLRWFGFARRTSGNVFRMKTALSEHQLDTDPDFVNAYVDGEIRFCRPKKTLRDVAETTFRVGVMRQANTPPKSVNPNAPLSEAVTLMMQNGFSQLPVMESERRVVGLISWKSIAARQASGCTCEKVGDCIEEHKEMSNDAPLLEAIRLIRDSECVVIKDKEKKVCGILTASDVCEEFDKLGEQFILIGEIEGYLRWFIGSSFSPTDLAGARDSTDHARGVESVDDLTLGEYQRLLENEECWSKLGLHAVDRKTFIAALDEVRVIRNDVMHFNPDPPKEEALAALRRFAKYLRELHAIRKGQKPCPT